MTPKESSNLFKYAVAATVAAELDPETAQLWQRHLIALDYADAEPALRAYVAGHRWCSTLAELLAACGLGNVANERDRILPGVGQAMCAEAARRGWRLSRATGVPDLGEESPRGGWLMWDPAKPPPYTVRLARVVAGRPEYEPHEQRLDRGALVAPSAAPVEDRPTQPVSDEVAEARRSAVERMRAALSRPAPGRKVREPVAASGIPSPALEAELAAVNARFNAELARAEASQRGDGAEVEVEDLLPY